jgi:hypothetical protein
MHIAAHLPALAHPRQADSVLRHALIHALREVLVEDLLLDIVRDGSCRHDMRKRPKYERWKQFGAVETSKILRAGGVLDSHVVVRDRDPAKDPRHEGRATRALSTRALFGSACQRPPSSPAENEQALLPWFEDHAAHTSFSGELATTIIAAHGERR